MRIQRATLTVAGFLTCACAQLALEDPIEMPPLMSDPATPPSDASLDAPSNFPEEEDALRERDAESAPPDASLGGDDSPDGSVSSGLGSSDGAGDVAMGDVGPDLDPLPPDAAEPDLEPDVARCEPEVCNGLDDDCDGQVDEGAGCPCDVVARDDSAYLVCAQPRSWAGARMHCMQHGYDLAVVEDAGEDAFLFNEINRRGFHGSWIGLNDLLEERTWVWLDGEPVGYEHWDQGEPNDGGDGEDCGIIMTTPRRASEWDDRPCGDERAYLCEVP